MINTAALYGIGKGGAQVVQGNPGMDAFNQILAQQQADRVNEQKLLAEKAKALRPDGLRNDADRNDFFNMVDDWRSKAIAAAGERDNRKRAQLNMEADDAYLKAQDLVSRSKQAGIMDRNFHQFAMNDATRHQLTDDAVQKGINNFKLGVNDPNYISDYATLQRQVDHTKVQDALEKATDAALKQSQWGTPTMKRQKIGNQMATLIQNSRTLDPNVQAQIYANLYQASPDLRKYFDDRYPQFVNDPNKAQLQIQEYIKDRGAVSETSKPEPKFDRHPSKWEVYPNGTNQAQPGTPLANFDIPYNGGKSHVQAKGYVPATGATINVAGSPSYNLSTGQKDKQTLSSGDYQLVGVGNVPFIKQGYALKGTIAQPNFTQQHPEAIEYRPMLHVQTKNPLTGLIQDKFVPYDRLPSNLPKATKVAISAFTPHGNSNSSGLVTVNLNGKVGQIPQDKVKDFLKKYPNAKVQ